MASRQDEIRALPYACGQCGSQWPADRQTCAFCGSAEKRENPILKASPNARTVYKCGRCGATWDPARARCVECDFDQRVAVADPLFPARSASSVAVNRYFTPPAERVETAPSRVEVVDIRLSWGSVIDIAFKFSVVFFIGQVIIILILYALLD